MGRVLSEYANVLRQSQELSEKCVLNQVELTDLKQRLALQRFVVDHGMAADHEAEKPSAKPFELTMVITTTQAEEERLKMQTSAVLETRNRIESHIQQYQQQLVHHLPNATKSLLGLLLQAWEEVEAQAAKSTQLYHELVEEQTRFLRMADSAEKLAKVVTAVTKNERWAGTGGALKKEAEAALATLSFAYYHHNEKASTGEPPLPFQGRARVGSVPPSQASAVHADELARIPDTDLARHLPELHRHSTMHV